MATLARIAADTKAPPAAQVAAACALLDRGWGKPLQMVTGDPDQPVSIEFRWADETPLQPVPDYARATAPKPGLIIEGKAESTETEPIISLASGSKEPV
jgi:hypothetical protein